MDRIFYKKDGEVYVDMARLSVAVAAERKKSSPEERRRIRDGRTPGLNAALSATAAELRA